ncbi:CPCC family cysteine-rich protein [Tahibacter sp. UC22_41]|uniref:CPCC family cysteine-rich protein n=1 Tax=Tahibacter sp. UC22_41 TaxID=3350178 RepID=UPI0036D7D370
MRWRNRFRKPRPAYQWPRFRSKYLCPCCGLPTLSSRSNYCICPICFWEDDGQDDADADEVRGGPNHEYSLTEARANFTAHLTMYRPSDTRPFERDIAHNDHKAVVIAQLRRAVQSRRLSDWQVALRAKAVYEKRIYAESL